MAEYKLSYTANEIDEKLGKIDNLSWNDLADKPFYSELVEGAASFDGDLTGKEYAEVDDGVVVVKITENTVTPEQLVGSTMVIRLPEEYGGDLTLEITEDMIQVQTVTDTTGLIMVGYEELVVIMVAYGDVAAAGAPFSDGTYFMYQSIDSAVAYTHSLSCLNGIQEVVYKIDKKYLPEMGLAKSEVEKMIANAIEEAIGDAIGGSY